MLTIPEQLLLIALQDEKGTVLFTSATVLPYSLIGAALTELFFSDAIELEEEIVLLKDIRANKNITYRQLYEFMKQKNLKKDLKYWILTLNKKFKNFKEIVLEHLVENQVLEKKQSKILGLFSKTTYPTLNPQPEIQLRESIRNQLLNDEIPNERYIALLQLCHVSSLLEDVFNQDELKKARQRLNIFIDRTNESEAIRAETSYFLINLSEAIKESSGTSGSF